MSVVESRLVAALGTAIPTNIAQETINEYKHIKSQFFLGEYRPSELNGARFAECTLRILEHVNAGTSTPFGQSLNSEKIIRSVENNVTLPDTIRFFIPRLLRIILDVRNRRNVAHVGGDVNPNYSDSLFIVHSADWVLTELIRHYYVCSIDEAAKIVSALNESRIPVVENVNGFMRVLNTRLTAENKVLVILYAQKPDEVSETNLRKWIEYQNPTNFRKKVLMPLHKAALIHYENNMCQLTGKGIRHTETNIELSYQI